jgi:hypothetical protein
VQSGERNREWPELALKTQKVMNAVYESAMSDGRPINPA